MADVGAFDLETDLPKFLESVLQNAEIVLQNVDNETQVDAEMHFEVVVQTVSLIWALQETSDVQPSDIRYGSMLTVTFWEYSKDSSYC